MHSKAHAGFTYRFDIIDEGGEIITAVEADNILPYEGINHMLENEFRNGARVSTWYIGLYASAYTPTAAETMASASTNMGEVTAYEGGARVAFAPAAAAGGIVSNAGAKAEFVITNDGSIQGGFLSSSSTRGSGSGILASIVQLPSPVTVKTGYTIRVTATNQITPS